jgi:hypothetical protein
MGRSVPNGTSVLVVRSPTPRRGEVWAYCEESAGVVVHRYRRRTGAGHVLQGDTRPRPDPPVRDDQLVGRVTAVRSGDRVRALGWGDRIVGACQRAARVALARIRRVARRLRRAA